SAELYSLFLYQCDRRPRTLHSFPTRRSSDLRVVTAAAAVRRSRRFIWFGIEMLLCLRSEGWLPTGSLRSLPWRGHSPSESLRTANLMGNYQVTMYNGIRNGAWSKSFRRASQYGVI